MCRCVQYCRPRPVVPRSTSLRLRRRSGVSRRLQRNVCHTDRLVWRLRQNSSGSHRRLLPYHQDYRLPTSTKPHTTDFWCVLHVAVFHLMNVYIVSSRVCSLWVRLELHISKLVSQQLNNSGPLCMGQYQRALKCFRKYRGFIALGLTASTFDCHEKPASKCIELVHWLPHHYYIDRCVVKLYLTLTLHDAVQFTPITNQIYRGNLPYSEHNI